jgi:RecG-like helicase
VGILRRFLERLTESDEQRLSQEIRTWAAAVGGATPIAEAPDRRHVRIAGVIRRLTVFPVDAAEALEVLLFDGTGELTATFMGRRGIEGLTLGTKVILDGVIGEQRGQRRMLNPRLELSASR